MKKVLLGLFVVAFLFLGFIVPSYSQTTPEAPVLVNSEGSAIEKSANRNGGIKKHHKMNKELRKKHVHKKRMHHKKMKEEKEAKEASDASDATTPVVTNQGT